jgi:hypothetical protein
MILLVVFVCLIFMCLIDIAFYESIIIKNQKKKIEKTTTLGTSAFLKSLLQLTERQKYRGTEHFIVIAMEGRKMFGN